MSQLLSARKFQIAFSDRKTLENCFVVFYAITKYRNLLRGNKARCVRGTFLSALVKFIFKVFCKVYTKLPAAEHSSRRIWKQAFFFRIVFTCKIAQYCKI